MHLRTRFIIKSFEKRKRLWPVLALLGPRQAGKSTFLRDSWAKLHGAKYLTFDRKEIRELASQQPEHFLLSQTEDLTQPVVIDEAHRVPEIFFSLKALIDERKRIGLFTLSGSVQFSAEVGIRESLAGRMGIARLFPFTVREAHQREFAPPFVTGQAPHPGCVPHEIEVCLERGGMPVFASIADRSERELAIESWLEAVCERDLLQLKLPSLSGDVARRILEVIARNPGIISTEITKRIRLHGRRLHAHLKALELLFLLNRLEPHPAGVGKARYYLFDAGVARALGATQQDVIPLLFLNEVLAQHEYSNVRRPLLMFYQSRGGSCVDLVYELNSRLVANNFEYTQTPARRSRDSLLGFLKHFPNSRARILAPTHEEFQLAKGVSVVPWSSCV